MGNTEKAESKTILSESTSIRIGVLIGLLSVFGSSIWWASGVNEKLNQIISSGSVVTTSLVELKAADTAFSQNLSEYKLKLALFEVKLQALQDKSNQTKP